MVAHGSKPGRPAGASGLTRAGKAAGWPLPGGRDRLWHSARALEFRFNRVKD